MIGGCTRQSFKTSVNFDNNWEDKNRSAAELRTSPTAVRGTPLQRETDIETSSRVARVLDCSDIL